MSDNSLDILELKEEIARLRQDNHRLEQENYDLRRFIETLGTISETGNETVTSGSEEQLVWWLNNILQQILELLDAPNGSLLLVDKASNELVFKLVQGDSTGVVGTRLKVGEGIAGWVALSGEPTIVPDVAKDPRFSARMDQETGFETWSLIAAPLVHFGEVLGVVEVLNQSGDTPFNDTQQAMLALFCDLAGTALAHLQIN